MTIAIHAHGALGMDSLRLERRLLSPLTGLLREMTFVARPTSGPRYCVMGGDLCAPEAVIGQYAGESYSHHVGGAGLCLDEAVVRTLGEAVERYSQIAPIAAPASRRATLATFDEVRRLSEALPPSDLRWFRPEQYAAEGFPFSEVKGDEAIAWVVGRDEFTDNRVLLPAQAVLVGYEPQTDMGEPRFATAVTTGTAVHGSAIAAQLNALLELIQIDASMRQWYAGVTPRVEVIFDEATSLVSGILDRCWTETLPRPRFFLANCLLPSVVSVECLISDPAREPAIAVGLGCAAELIPAMYRALREAIAVYALARINLWRYRLALANGGRRIDPVAIYNLDDNVTLYGEHAAAEKVLNLYGKSSQVAAKHLIADRADPAHETLARLKEELRHRGVRLFSIDLGGREHQQLGLTVSRYWSPDLIPLCLPSAPYMLHPRLRERESSMMPHPFP